MESEFPDAAAGTLQTAFQQALGDDWVTLIPALWIPIAPRPKARPGFAVKQLQGASPTQAGGFSAKEQARGYKVISYNRASGAEKELRDFVLDYWGERPIYEGPVWIQALFALSRPQWANKVPGPIYLHRRTPDLDNLQKLMDALNTTKKHPGIWRDDRQIVRLDIAKCYAERGSEAHMEMAILVPSEFLPVP